MVGGTGAAPSGGADAVTTTRKPGAAQAHPPRRSPPRCGEGARVWKGRRSGGERGGGGGGAPRGSSCAARRGGRSGNTRRAGRPGAPPPAPRRGDRQPTRSAGISGEVGGGYAPRCEISDMATARNRTRFHLICARQPQNRIGAKTYCRYITRICARHADIAVTKRASSAELGGVRRPAAP